MDAFKLLDIVGTESADAMLLQLALAMQVAAFVRQDAVRLFEALLATLRERSA